MKIRNLFIIFSSIWVLLYLLTNPMLCMETGPSTPYLSLTQYLLLSPEVNANTKGIVRILAAYETVFVRFHGGALQAHDRVLALVLAQQEINLPHSTLRVGNVSDYIMARNSPSEEQLQLAVKLLCGNI